MDKDKVLEIARECGASYGPLGTSFSASKLHKFAAAIEAATREEMLTFKPNLGFDSDEPSLTGMVRRYYAASFVPEEAAEWTREYLEAIRNMGKEG